MFTPMKPYIVGVCGCSGAGKTYICKQIVEKINGSSGKFSKNDIAVISQDYYYYGGDPYTNYDVLEAVDFNLMEKQLLDLRNGQTISCPIYDFSVHARDPINTRVVSPAKIIVVEGILIFANENIRKLFDLKVFVDTSEATRIFRRIERDVKERGRTIDDVRTRYESHVVPSQEQYILPSAVHADIRINNQTGKYVGLGVMLDHLLEMVKNFN
jgi:uridine kinase